MKKFFILPLLAALWMLPLSSKGQNNCLIETFPWSESFDSWSNFDPCWSWTMGGSDGSFQLYPSYNHTGLGYSVKCPGPDPYMIALPEVDAPLNELSITFWLYKDDPWGFYSGQVQVGYCTDTSNLSTFTMVENVTCTPASTWTMFTVSFANVPASATGRIAFCKPVRINSGLYLDDVVLTRASTCGDAVDLSVVAVGQHAAGLQWRNSLDAESNYMVRYRPEGALTWDSVPMSTPYGFISNLLSDTTYEVSVRSACDGEDASYCYPLTFHTAGCGSAIAGLVDSASSNGHTTQYPADVYENFSYSQMIYPASSLGALGADSIRSIAFFNISPYTLSNRTMQLRMALTERSGFESAQDLTPWNELSPVFNGSVVMNHGWVTLTLDEPFAYDGASNLLLALFDSTNEMSFFAAPWWCISDLGTGTAFFSGGSASVAGLTSNEGSLAEYTPVCRFSATCDPSNDCLPPLVMVLGGDPNSVDFIIEPGGQEQAWDVAFRPQGQDDWFEEGTTSDRLNTISGLNPGSTVILRITTPCSGGNGRSTYVSALTECGPIGLPYLETFNSYTNGTTSIPCWTLSYGTGSSIPHVEMPYGANSKMLSMNAGAYLVMPPVMTPYDMAQLNLRLLLSCPDRNEWSSATYGIQVGVMEHPDSLQSFLPLHTIISSTTDYHTISFDALDTLNSDARYVAIQALSSNGLEAVLIDDLWLRYTPSCPTPENLSLQSVTSNSITLNWEGESDSYLIEYGPNGMAMGSGSFVTANDTVGTVAGLQAGTVYDLYVYGLCGDTSFGAGPLTVTTLCGSISLPYSNNFDGEQLPTTDHTYTLPMCWSTLEGTAEIFRDLHLSEGTSASGQNSLRMLSGTTVALPLLDGHSANQVQIDLDAMAEGIGGRLVVGVCDSLAASSFTAVDTIELSDYSFDHATSYLLFYQGTGQYLALRALGFETYVDNVVLSLAPTCFPVANLRCTGNTSTSVTLEWDEQGLASQWEVAYNTTGTLPSSGTVVSTNPYTLTGLTPGEMLYAYVRSYCSASDQGEWVGPIAVAANSWVMRPNQCDTVLMCNGYIFDDGGANGNYSNGQTSMIVLRPDPNEGPAALRLVGTGHTQTYAYSVCDYIRIYEGTDTNNASLRRLYTGNNPDFSFDITIPSGVATIVFESDDWQTAEGFQIYVECQPLSCPMVDNLTASSTTTSLSVTWTPGGSESQWLVSCGDRDTLVGSPAATFNGLYSSTNYEVSVRPLCGVGDTGVARLALFATDCDVIMLSSHHPLFESFETYYCPPNDCWTLLYNAAINRPSHSTDQALHGERCFSFNSFAQVSDYNQYLITPQFSSGDAIQASFAYRSYDYIRTETLIVGYSPSSNDPTDSSWVWIDTIQSGLDNMWLTYTTTLPATAAYFGLHYANTRDCYYLYIDSLVLSTTFSGCSAPTLAEPEVLGYDGARLSWSGMGSSYQFQYKEASAQAWNGNLQDVEGTEVTLGNLLSGTTYQYRVRMVCPEGEYSNWSTGGFTTEVLPCYTPTDLQADNITGTSAQCTWQAGADEETWELSYWAQGEVFTTTVTGETSTLLTNLYSNVTYQAALRSVCGAGAAHSEWSDTIEFTTLACPMPTDVEATNVISNGATISWTAPEGYDRFALYYGISESTTGMASVEVTGTSHTLTDLQSNTLYYVAVQTLCGEDWRSNLTDNISFRTTVGINHAETPAISLYPNPANGLVTIAGYEGEVQIVDMTGRIVLQAVITSQPQPITLEALPAGAYFVKMGSEVKRLIVK